MYGLGVSTISFYIIVTHPPHLSPFTPIVVHDKLFDRKIWKNMSSWKRRKQANMRSFQAVQELTGCKLHFLIGKMLKYA